MRYFITGFMGSGKTYLGCLWAAKHGLAFYDLDALIEEEERMAVAGIFKQRGEDYFREKEAAILRNTDRFHDCIIACGGGTPCFYDNIDWMNRNGVTIFLDAGVDDIYKHIMLEKELRPLLPDTDEEGIKNFIRLKKSERLHFYEQAQIILQDEDLTAEGFNTIVEN
jgi:shikimate kinase